LYADFCARRRTSPPPPRELFGGVLAIDFSAWVLALWLLIEPASQR
jgi:hypothetical protein